jgi:hypothetical protein
VKLESEASQVWLPSSIDELRVFEYNLCAQFSAIRLCVFVPSDANPSVNMFVSFRDKETCWTLSPGFTIDDVINWSPAHRQVLFRFRFVFAAICCVKLLFVSGSLLNVCVSTLPSHGMQTSKRDHTFESCLHLQSVYARRVLMLRADILPV